MSLAIGIDVGATKIAAALVDARTGGVAAALRQRTGATRGPAAVLGDCLRMARDLARGRDVAAIGIGVCEVVDPSGRMRSGETIDWREIDVAGALGAVAPAVVASDVRAAALAEARFGAGREPGDFLYVSVGSGISHCLVQDGVPRPGARGCALATGAPLVEAWSGGLALARLTGHETAEDALADPAPAAVAVVEAGARQLGAVLATLVNALDPAAVVLGGGLGLNPAYRDRIVAAMRAAIYDDEVRKVPALPAALGAEAGVVGAALTAADRAGR